MTAQPNDQANEKETLRVALDKDAAQSYAAMVEKIKTENPFIKVHPSLFVSFVISDFYRTYFEKDLRILVAEFFDAQGFHDAAAEKAKGQNNFAEIMESAISDIKRIKAKRRRQIVRRRKQGQGTQSVAPNEKV